MGKWSREHAPWRGMDPTLYRHHTRLRDGTTTPPSAAPPGGAPAITRWPHVAWLLA